MKELKKLIKIWQNTLDSSFIKKYLNTLRLFKLIPKLLFKIIVNLFKAYMLEMDKIFGPCRFLVKSLNFLSVQRHSKEGTCVKRIENFAPRWNLTSIKRTNQIFEIKADKKFFIYFLNSNHFRNNVPLTCLSLIRTLD